MPEKMQLNYRVCSRRLEGIMSSRAIMLVMVFSSILIILVTYGTTPPGYPATGNAIFNGQQPETTTTTLDLKSLSNKQLQKRGFPLECRMTNELEDVTVWIKGDIAKMMVSKKGFPTVKYVITPDTVYSYSSIKDQWLAYASDSQIIEKDGIGNVTAIDFLAGTLNLYNCSITEFDTQTLSFPNDD